MINKLYKFLFGDWEKWKDVSCVESVGWVKVVQTRTEKRTNKRQLRTVRTFVNCGDEMKEIKENIFK